jgi:hypothetical protein
MWQHANSNENIPVLRPAKRAVLALAIGWITSYRLRLMAERGFEPSTARGASAG